MCLWGVMCLFYFYSYRQILCRLMQFCYPAVTSTSSQRCMWHWVSVVYQPYCFIPPELRVNPYDFVFNGGHIDIAISIEIAFSHANRSFNSLYKGLLLGETKFKMAQAICHNGIFQFPCSALLSPPLSLSLSPFPSPFIFQLFKVTALLPILEFQVC